MKIVDRFNSSSKILAMVMLVMGFVYSMTSLIIGKADATVLVSLSGLSAGIATFKNYTQTKDIPKPVDTVVIP